MAVRRSSWTAVGVRVGGVLNMCVIVFPPRFRGVKGNAGLYWGVPQRGDWSVSHSCHTDPWHAANPRPGPRRQRGPRPGLGAAGDPQAFSSNSSHQHKGDWGHAGSLLRKGWGGIEWVNRGMHTHTHTPTGMLWSCLSCLRARRGGGGGTKWG